MPHLKHTGPSPSLLYTSNSNERIEARINSWRKLPGHSPYLTYQKLNLTLVLPEIYAPKL